jgi:hypothetical protein
LNLHLPRNTFYGPLGYRTAQLAPGDEPESNLCLRVLPLNYVPGDKWSKEKPTASRSGAIDPNGTELSGLAVFAHGHDVDSVDLFRLMLHT